MGLLLGTWRPPSHGEVPVCQLRGEGSARTCWLDCATGTLCPAAQINPSRAAAVLLTWRLALPPLRASHMFYMYFLLVLLQLAMGLVYYLHVTDRKRYNHRTHPHASQSGSSMREACRWLGIPSVELLKHHTVILWYIDYLPYCYAYGKTRIKWILL